MDRLTEWYDDGDHKGVMVKEERGEHVLKTLFDELDEGYNHSLHFRNCICSFYRL